MKNSQKGFIAVPLIIAIVAVLAVAGGVYFYETKTKSPAGMDAQSQKSSSACGDFALFSDFILKTIQNPDSQKAMEMNKYVITSFKWKRSSSEPFVSYPVINGIKAFYDNQQTLMASVKNDSDLLGQNLDAEVRALGLVPDALNTLPFKSNDISVYQGQTFGSYSQVFGFRKDNSLYSLELEAERTHTAPGEGIVTITCGKAIDQYDKVYSALNFKADPAVKNIYGDYVAIADVSLDNTVYALLGSPNQIKNAAYYYFDGTTAKLVSKDSYPTQCAPLESQKVGQGMRCYDFPSTAQRTVNYSSISTSTVQQNYATAATNTSSVKKSYCGSDNYSVKNGVMYWGANPMQADLSTFRILPRFPDDGGFDLCLSEDANHLFSAERIVAPRPQSITYLSLQGTKNCKSYRAVGGVGVFEGVYLLAGSDAQTFIDLTPADGEKQGMCYGKDKNQAYSAYGVGGFGPIVGADPQTFKVLNANYTKDAGHVYYRGNLMPNADTITFVALGELWAKDKNNVYHRGTIISGADTATFVALDDDHGKDATHAFDPFGNAFKQIADVSSLTSVSSFWLKDKLHIYTSNGQILDQADPATFADLGLGYGKDASHIFYGNTGTFGSLKGNIIPEADPASFVVVADNYGKDNAHIYSIGKMLQDADVNTFTRIGDSIYFKDKSHIWYRNDNGPGGLGLIPGADLATFVLTDSYGGAKDAYHTYGFSAKGFFYAE